MDDGHFNEQDVTDALKLAGVKGTKMSFDQFVQAYEALQDLLEDYDDEEGQNSDPSDDDEDKDESDDEVYSDEGDSEEQSDEEFLRETFAELKDKKTNKVSVKAFYEWDEIAEVVADGLLTKEDVTAALKDAGVVGKDMTLEQFSAAFSTLQDKLEGEDDEEEEEDKQSDEELMREAFDELKDAKTKKVFAKAFTEWEEIAELVSEGLLTKEGVKDALKAAGVSKDMTFEQFSDVFSSLQDQIDANQAEADEDDDADTDYEGEDNDEDEEEQSDEELMREVFDELKDAKTKKVSAKAFTEWEEIAELVAEGLLTKEGVSDALKAAGVSKDMSFDQFSDVFSALQDQIDANQEEDDEADTDSEGEDNEDEDEDEQSDEELMREAFDELKDAKTKKVSAKAFTEWEEIADLIKEGYLTKDFVKDALKAAGVSKDMSFEQFSAVFSTLQDQIDAKEEEAASKGTTSADSDDDEEEEDDDDDMSYEEELEDAFNTLKGKDGKVPKKAFQQWSVISDMLKDGSITQGDLKQAFDDAEITGNSLDFEEFIEVYEILDEFAYGADGDDDEVEGQNSDHSTTTGDEEDNDEELTAELKSEFKQLTKGQANKGSKTITIKTFKSWEPIAELIEDGILSTTDLAEVLKDLGIKGGEKGGELNESQFIEAYKRIEDLTAEYDDDEEDEEGQNSDREDDEEDDGEWAYEEKMNEYFDELKGKTRE